MPNYFSTKFKQLRKNSDLTQEETAVLFHVSPQSVSRWETGANYPDIEILPHIAAFFKVTVDELLGTALILDESKAKQHKEEIRQLLHLGKLNEAIVTARKAVKNYPANYDLQSRLMHALCLACRADSPEAEANTAKFKDEIITLGERIIAYCTDQSIVLWIKHTLFMQYVNWEMTDDAKKILETLPSEEWLTYNANVQYVLEGEKWQQNQQTSIGR